MIKSAASTRSLKNQKFEDNNQSENNFDNGESIKKIKLIEDKNNGKERISQRVTRQMARVMQNSESRDEYGVSGFLPVEKSGICLDNNQLSDIHFEDKLENGR
ncbi:kinase-like domain-containing protein [Rhizophagus irregularis DAOM 181602=DAOM 197198]|nr:kinase-like domain-containing protein [Rhizophagus irregularis DAOM 181602=DAOM 197198]